MNGCQTCGGFGMHHDPVAHEETLEAQALDWQCTDDCCAADDDWHPCPECGCMCSPQEWACWRCGAVQEDQ